MAGIIRDSGIIDDDDESQNSLSNSTSSLCDCSNNNFSYVQRLRKRFECLAQEKFHDSCNWWLEEIDEEHEHEVVAAKMNDVTSSPLETRRKHRTPSPPSPPPPKTPPPILNLRMSRQNSTEINGLQPPEVPKRKSRITKQKSEEFIIEDEVPKIILKEFDGEHETNDDDDSDSFESASDSEHENEDDFEVNENEENFIIAQKPSRPPSISSNYSNSKLFNILTELIENEKNYVRTLKNGIENFMTALDRDHLPKALRGQKFHIFANIQTIYDFHKNEFLPALLKCDEEDPIQFASTFNNFLIKDYFYSYIIYAINRRKSELLCNQTMDFWREIQNKCGDRLGINSFLLQPIQRLPRYKLLLNEIIKNFVKDLENTKQEVAAFCVAEKNMQRLLDTVNESMSINDVKNCYEIDILCQGKFKKMNEFDMYDWDSRRRFHGKVFLFEHCIVYTEALNREFMEYRGNFDMSTVGIIHKDAKSKFRLFVEKRGRREVEFRANMNVVNDWNDQITGMLMKFVNAEKLRNESRRKSMSYISVQPSNATDSIRSSILSNLSDKSYKLEGGSFRSSSSSSGREYENDNANDSRKSSKWYV